MGCHLTQKEYVDPSTDKPIKNIQLKFFWIMFFFCSFGLKLLKLYIWTKMETKKVKHPHIGEQNSKYKLTKWAVVV